MRAARVPKQRHSPESVDDAGVDLGMLGGNVHQAVNRRGISPFSLDQRPLRAQDHAQPKTGCKERRGEGSPQGSPDQRCEGVSTEERWTASRPRARPLGWVRGSSHRQGREVPGVLAGKRAIQGTAPGSTEAQANRLPGAPPRPGWGVRIPGDRGACGPTLRVRVAHRSQRSIPSTSPLVGTPVPAVARTCSTPGTRFTEQPRTWRTDSAMPFMPWR